MIGGVKRILFGIGSNLGDRKFNIESAISMLEAQLELKNPRISDYLPNQAMLPEGAPQEWDMEFLNICYSAYIDLSNFPPLEILKIIKNIELKLGRKDRGRWSPREIDIDILVIDGVKINIEGKLTIPHPGLFEREFFYKLAKQIEKI